MKRIALLLTAACLFGIHANAAERPNIVFILADDLGARDLGCYGSTFYETPNLDRLAKEGAHLRNAFVSTSLCSPSRASIR